MNDRQDQREHNRADQACEENGPASRRIEDDFASSSPFGWIWFFCHNAPPSNQTLLRLIVPARSRVVEGNAAKGS
jgi:hypothetical protein